MKATHGLALHDRAISDLVIPDREGFDLDSYASFLEQPRHAARALMDVGEDSHSPQTVTHFLRPTLHRRVPNHRQLALSR